MGFDAGQRTYRLLFEGSNLEGAEVIIRSTPIGVVRQLESSTSDQVSLSLFCEYAISWNLERDGEPVKLTVEDILDKVETVHAAKILQEWLRAARGVTAPLDPPSIDGESSEEELTLPMEALSEDQLS
jgi:hypothetical protein